MSELKAYTFSAMERTGLADYYLKSEADKVIAELEEKRDTAEKLLNKALDCVSNGKNHMMSLARKKNHADYKRCLAMADKCVDLCHKAKDLYRWAEDENLEHYYNHKIEFFARWHRRWLKIAEKLKEVK